MKVVKKLAVVIISFLLILSSLAGCATSGKTLLSLDGSEMSVNTFQLFLSRQKGLLCSAYAYGSEALSASFWDTLMSADGTTYNDYYTNLTLENAKTYVAALALFEEKGLKLPDSYIDNIDKELKELMENDADGSKAAFNSILAQYGANYNILKDAYIMEAKISYLMEDLFGANGSRLSSTLIEDYFSKTYARFKQVFFYTYNIVYETDEFGDSIYYTSDGKVAYDVTKTPKTDESGNKVKDANGSVIYITEDGRIAYDKKNGSRKTVLDASGNVVIEDFSAQKINQIKEDALIIMEEVSEGDYVKFDALVEEYSMDPGMLKYTNGYYITETTDYDSPEVVKALFEMNEGEVRLIQSSYGFHVVMKYELEEKAYENKDNSEFFVNSETGEYIFMNDLMNKLFAEYLAPYTENVVIDRELLKGIDIKNIGANFYY